jgi:hypothetical protein
MECALPFALNRKVTIYLAGDDGNKHLWLKNTPRLDYPEPNVIPFPNNDHREINVDEVEKATEEWQQADHSEGDNGRFYQYAKKLQWAGMPLPEIERKLQSQVQAANKPMKRRTKIKGILTSLKQSMRKVAV